MEYHIENLKIEVGNRTPNCLRHQVWLDVSTFNNCLFTTKPREFLLILICETSQIFVWRNKAFIFFQKSDIIFRVDKCLSHCRIQLLCPFHFQGLASNVLSGELLSFSYEIPAFLAGEGTCFLNKIEQDLCSKTPKGKH